MFASDFSSSSPIKSIQRVTLNTSNPVAITPVNPARTIVVLASLYSFTGGIGAIAFVTVNLAANGSSVTLSWNAASAPTITAQIIEYN